jgi:hypothetical protein
MVRFDKSCALVTRAVEYFLKCMEVGGYPTQEGQAEMKLAGSRAERLGLLVN